MDSLIHFHFNKCLFNCDKQEFNVSIKLALTKLFSYDDVKPSQNYIFNYCYEHGKCIICSQKVSTINIKSITSPLVICSLCCYECDVEFAIIEFFKPCFDKYLNTYWVTYNSDYDTYEGRYDTIHEGRMMQSNATHFIDNSHKLIHRFYHTTILIFLMAITDGKSYCNELNLDVIIHMLKFIY